MFKFLILQVRKTIINPNMPQEAEESSNYEKSLIETGGMSVFDIVIPPSFRKFGNWMDRSQYDYYDKKVTESDVSKPPLFFFLNCENFSYSLLNNV